MKTIQTHKECADRIREILLDKTVEPELVDTMTRAALALDVLDKL